MDGDGEKAVVVPKAWGPVHIGSPVSNGCKVSVVVPTYNRSEMLYRVLYCLFRQQDPNYEVLVSNDDSPNKHEETLKVCEEFQKLGMPLRHFYTGQFKRGVGWSVETYPYNVGIRHATGDIVILNSGDVMSVTNTIHQHRQRHTAGDRVYVSTVHAITLDVQNRIDTYPWKTNSASLLFKGSCYKMFTGYGISYTTAYEIEDAGSPYHFQMSVRTKHLHQIRGFDEDFYGMMPCGDDDLALRLKRLGLGFVFTPEILAIHQHHQCPDLISQGTAARSNPKTGGGHMLFQQRQGGNIIRNKSHEWGQFPRDMINLPDMSGVVG